MKDMNTWFNLADKAGFFTVGERQTLKELMNTLGSDAQNAISALCDAIYKLGQLADSNVKPNPRELSAETKKWLDARTPEERLEIIKDICVDWDGYRTAAGLGSLVNEIWAYTAYPCKNEAHVMSLEEIKSSTRKTLWMESKIDNTLTQLDKKGIAELFYIGALYNWANFNKIWRCWDKKPTKKQIKETAWDD